MQDKPSTRQLTEDEWIILLDLHQSHKNETLNAKHPAIVEASMMLNKLGEQTGHRLGDGFRPPSGLHRQLRTFLRLEQPMTASKPTIPRLAESVWRRFAKDPAGCHQAAAAIRGRIK
jgi:hypothetical protein